MKKSKKGFTLAELLIVVAIIAVLTAIAVPLFVGALNNSESNVKAANIRAVRGAAVVDILQNAKMPSTDPAAEGTTDTSEKYYSLKNKQWVLEGPWYYEAYVSENGDIVGLKLLGKEGATGTTGVKDACVDASTATGGKANAKYKYYVTVKVNTISTAAVSAT